MTFSEAHTFLLVTAKYKFAGSHILFFRPEKEERQACRMRTPVDLLPRLEEAFAAVDAYHDMKESHQHVDN
jgi:hypothetical protein